MSSIEKILLVGHCGPDSWMLQQVAGSAIPGAQIIMVNSDTQLAGESDDKSLLLVNRALDGDFRASDGIELIRSVRNANGPVAMLISNYPEAQAAAVAVGAVPGFGKSRARADGLPAIQKAIATQGSKAK